MNKELEILDDWLWEKINEDEISTSDLEYFKRLRAAITELKAINEAKPSEALKLVKRTCELYIQSTTHLIGSDIIERQINESLEATKQSLLKAQEQEKENSVLKACIKDWEDDYEHLKYAWENRGKVLEIIKKKCIDNINLGLVKHCVSYESYKLCSQNNINANDNIEKKDLLTKEEFDLLKRWAENEQ